MKKLTWLYHIVLASTLETDAYIWHYAPLVLHAGNVMAYLFRRTYSIFFLLT